MDSPEHKAIRDWMNRNVSNFIDQHGEVNCTLMVETWDNDCDDGCATLDEDHPAWTIAVEVAERYEKLEKQRKDTQR